MELFTTQRVLPFATKTWPDPRPDKVLIKDEGAGAAPYILLLTAIWQGVSHHVPPRQLSFVASHRL
ncbi:MAG: hypothetical protein ACRC6F_01580 [Aeromonas sp.]